MGTRRGFGDVWQKTTGKVLSTQILCVSRSRHTGIRLCPLSGCILFSGNADETYFGTIWNIMQRINWETKQGCDAKLPMATERNSSNLNDT